MKKASKSRRKKGIWQPTGQPTRRIDPHTSSFPQCRLTVCTAYLQVEIYSHIEMHSHCTRTHHHAFTSGNLLSLSDLAGRCSRREEIGEKEAKREEISDDLGISPVLFPKGRWREEKALKGSGWLNFLIVFKNPLSPLSQFSVE